MSNQQRQFQPSEKLNEESYTTVKPLYKYGYSVFDPYTMDVKSQWEHRDGDVVRGAYNILEPDGSLRIVEYTSDKDTGFQAVVKKIPFYIDMRRRPIETIPNFLNSNNQIEEEMHPIVYHNTKVNTDQNRPVIVYNNKADRLHQVDSQYQNQYQNQYKQQHSGNYLQQEMDHRHHQKDEVPVEVFKSLSPVFQ